jgi:leucyl-tRNA synthetase
MVTHEIYQGAVRTEAASGQYGGNFRAKFYFPEEVVRFHVDGQPAAMPKEFLQRQGIDPTDTNALTKAWNTHWIIDAVGDEEPQLGVIPSAKMSKSKKNVVDPERIIATYGADTARWFVLSDSPPERDVEWTASGAEAANRHLARVHRIASDIAQADTPANADDDALLKEMHKTIFDVTQGIDSFGFNASIARLYAFTNVLQKSKAGAEAKRRAARVLAQLMSPMTPHLSEELWALLGGTGLIAEQPWPEADAAMLVEDTVTMPIQINGKRRAEIEVPKDLPKDEVEKLALAEDAVQRALGDGPPKKLIVVPGRIVNVVV